MVYNYTKPRGPIAAMYSSPGPKYGLPGLVGIPQHDPRSVHSKGPAYSFGLRHGKWKDDASPGPCYLPQHRVYRTGIDGTPQYSLYSRQRDGTAFKGPGPGAYNPQGAGQMAYMRAPAYSFGGRHGMRGADNTPAPNAYTLPGCIGKTAEANKPQAPIISMTSRSGKGGFSEDLTKTPGPGAYTTTHPSIYKSKAPGYTITSRNIMPGDHTQKPAPNAYSVSDTNSDKPRAPGYSFGIRHSEYVCPLIAEVNED